MIILYVREKIESSCNDILFFLKTRYPDISIIRNEPDDDFIDVLKHMDLSLVIIDTESPCKDILSMIENVRMYTDSFFIVLTGIADEDEHARLLEAGADDIIARPYSSAKFEAKCVALLRRTTEFESIHIGGPMDSMEINFNSKTVIVCGQRVHMTPIEFSLLSELVKDTGCIVPVDTLLEKVWGESYRGEYTLLKAYIYRLRNKLSLLGDREQIIKNERGTGYLCGI